MIGPARVQVWRFPLDAASCSAASLALWRQWLSRQELARADGFRGEEHRREYVVAHAGLRWVLGLALGVAPAAVQFRNDLRGEVALRSKPALAEGQSGKDGELDLRFSLSHTRGAALIAIANSREVGIDIERIRPMDELGSMAETVFSSKELEQWKLLSGGDRKIAFYRVWTRKEAYLKAIGLGLFRDLHGVTVPVSANCLDRRSETEYDAVPVEDLAGSGAWTVTDVPVEAGYSAALCFEGLERPHVVVKDLIFGAVD